MININYVYHKNENMRSEENYFFLIKTTKE